ncbi:classical arabinogalactan protein 26 [Heracleum sosnowskyi]|uniref:Classical arabinogalactan protein 26 n=1 Tax=Heracleum sosnowskyi TaxID=360622 RepID=A0AAD8IHP6_9APIA|nr:classical arabinogalactan protein 26 [Heracleum sosnowskyi]
MAAQCSFFLALIILSMVSLASSQLPVSVISAAPALLPFEPPLASPPALSPTLSPDMMPVFPSETAPSPSESTFPVIPSSPSPPNPDEMFAPGPLSPFSPSGLPESSAFSLSTVGLSSSAMLLLGYLVVFA